MVTSLLIMADGFEIEESPGDETQQTEADLQPETSKNPVYPRDYFLKEFDALRKEVEWILPDSRAVERNVLIAIGAFTAFLIKEHVEMSSLRYGSLAWWIPFIFAVAGAVRSIALWLKFGQIGEYISKIEEYVVKDQPKTGGPEGWERFQNSEKSNGKKSRRRSFVVASSVIFGQSCCL